MKFFIYLFFIYSSFSTAQVYTVTTVAGSDNGYADGVAGVPARFNSPTGLAIDASGNVYVAASGNNTIRKITPSGYVTTFAGSTKGYSGFNDGVGTAASFNSPMGVSIDAAGNLYVADSGNNKIRKITPNGVVSTLAGTTQGYQDGTGTIAKFNNPTSVANDSSGNVYVADKTNQKIRKITPSGYVTTFVGTSGLFSAPTGIAIDANNNVYVADSSITKSLISKITPNGVVTTLAGNGNVNSPVDGQSTSASFRSPEGITVDKNGNVYVADTDNSLIRKITPSGYVTTVANNLTQPWDNTDGALAKFYKPAGVVTDATGNVYISDTGTHRIRKLTTNGLISSFAGYTVRGNDDGIGVVTRFSEPTGLAIDKNGNIYVADKANHKIRKITPSGTVSTFAGTTQGYADGNVTTSQFYWPKDVAIDASGNVYVADSNNNRIRKITPTGIVTTFAGGIQGYNDGANPKFSNPSGVATDKNGNVYVADSGNNKIRKITPSGVVTTLAGSANYVSGYIDGIGTAARFDGPSGIETDADGNIFVADMYNNKIRKITPNGVVTTLASSVSGIFSQPHTVATDTSGNVYVADTANRLIRIITPSNEVYTVAGGGPVSQSVSDYDGVGTSASFNSPNGVATDLSGNIYVADTENHKIKKITQSSLGLTQYFYKLKNIKLYPNPTHEMLNIDVNSYSANAQVRITDITGKIIYSQKVESSNLSLSTSNYNKGTYFLIFFDGNIVETQKFIVN